MVRLRSVKKRLLIAFIAPVCLVLTLALFSFLALSTMATQGETIYKEEIAPLQILKRISDNYAVHVIDTVNKANAGLLSAEEAGSELSKAQRAIELDWQFYLQGGLSAREQQLSRRAEVLFKQADQAIVGVRDRLRQQHGLVTGLLSDFDGPLYRSIDPVTALIEALTQLRLERAKEHYLQSSQVYDRLNYWLLAIGGLTVALCLYITVRVTRSLQSTSGSERRKH